MSTPSTPPPPPLRIVSPCKAVLFDLDGTLADTAPDLAAAIHQMQRDRGLPPTPLDQLRPLTSAGARGLLGGAFGIAPDALGYAAMRDEFLAHYANALCVHTVLFPGISALLDLLDARRIRWGIVTNKVMRLTDPLIAQLGLKERAACVVSGDTTAYAKPHPAPLLHAAQQLNLTPAQIVYVGDDLRDIQAGAAAGMPTVAAAYGYCGGDIAPADWPAQQLTATTDELHQLLSRITS